MNVNRRSWHARVYLWWHAHKYHSAEHPPTHSNLCPYVRVVLIWAPLRFLFTNWATKWVPICVISILLYGVPKLLGYLSYEAKIVFWFAEEMVASVLLGALILTGITEYGTNPFRKFGDWWEHSEAKAMLAAYARAGHDRFCPEITLGSDEERGACPQNPHA